MRKDELIKYTYFNEEELPLSERIKLSRMTKKEPDRTTLILFNKQPNFLREYEKIYFAKYLNKEFAFYEKGDDIFVAPENAAKKDLSIFAVPEDSEKQARDEFYEEIGVGYRDLRTYSLVPGAKYKFIKGKGLSGYPTVDRPWELFGAKIDLDSNNILDFYRKSRKFLGPKKCLIDGYF